MSAPETADPPLKRHGSRPSNGAASKPKLKLLLAAPRGFCAGVDRAIRIVELAGLAERVGGSQWAESVFDGWQISGIYRIMSGAPYTPGFSVSGIGNQNLTGSFTPEYCV